MKQIMFIGTPHLGSSILEDTKEMLVRVLPGLQPFLENSNIAISTQEFTEQIL